MSKWLSYDDMARLQADNSTSDIRAEWFDGPSEADRLREAIWNRGNGPVEDEHGNCLLCHADIDRGRRHRDDCPWMIERSRRMRDRRP